jgi:ABC-type polysaccharide/polyol phosphate transport system ATPase subunit
MSNVVLTIENLRKDFTVLHNRGGIKHKLAGLFNPRFRERRETLRVINNISFSLSKGESISLIGPNGSGKSTLLQLVSQILLPTQGRVQSFGRIAPLIELGVGFHPELSGEENIYLNASLFGLSNKETSARFNDIADFSGLGDFIDTPVKNYSSGMYMRLGFAVAVHVDPDILLADEILAVGDQGFQEKCYQRIRDMQDCGMALILVTHSKDQGRSFCQRYLCLEKGSVIDEGVF